MPKTRVFTLEGSPVAAGSTETLTQSDNENWVIERIQVFEEGNNTLSSSTATLSIAGDSFTDSSVLIAAHQEAYSDLPVPEVDWPSNKQFKFDWTNSEGASRTINVLLWVRPMSTNGGG